MPLRRMAVCPNCACQFPIRPYNERTLPPTPHDDDIRKVVDIFKRWGTICVTDMKTECRWNGTKVKQILEWSVSQGWTDAYIERNTGGRPRKMYRWKLSDN